MDLNKLTDDETQELEILQEKAIADLTEDEAVRLYDLLEKVAAAPPINGPAGAKTVGQTVKQSPHGETKPVAQGSSKEDDEIDSTDNLSGSKGDELTFAQQQANMAVGKKVSGAATSGAPRGGDKNAGEQGIVKQGQSDVADDDKGTAGKAGPGRGGDNKSGDKSPVLQGTSKVRAEDIDVSDATNALFETESLGEEFRNKAETIFKAAVVNLVNEKVDEYNANFASALQEQVESSKQQLAGEVDEYLDYIVEKWMDENKVAIEQGTRTEITNDFISGLRELFMSHSIEIPDDRIDAVESLTARLEETQGRLDEALRTSIGLATVVKDKQKQEVLAEELTGLTDTEVEKMVILSEGIDFSDEDSYRTKVKIIKESYFGSKQSRNDSAGDINEAFEDPEAEASEEVQSKGPMTKYITALGRAGSTPTQK